LAVFAEVRRAIPSLRLVVTNPGYFDMPAIEQDGVDVLGTCTHSEVMERIRGSLCLFGMHTYPENFGIVFAECHAMGIPVLTTPIGAAPEVIADHEQLIDADDVDRIVARLKRWRAGGRPEVVAQDRFALPKIAHEWEMLLDLAF
jgi:glycosyltransferase involved in cell wall biosynthesis